MPRSSTRTLARAALLLVLSACSGTDEQPNPLDPERIRELAVAQGSASGDARSGTWSFEFSAESCDCPSFELDGALVDLCALASFAALELELVEGSGVLGMSSDAAPDFGLLSGAIEADGRFTVAGVQDLSNLGGELEALRRVDGRFAAGNDSAEGTAAQRLLGELPGAAIDCRWTGDFVANRI